MLTHKIIQVRGIVQGVGFRPFVYNLANSLELFGSIYNTDYGVEIDIIGKDCNIEKLLHSLTTNPPKSSQIHSIECIAKKLPPTFNQKFIIKNSTTKIHKTAIIPPDFAVCKDCTQEILDTNNRRYLYPFTSCIHCGARYSLLYNLPYDRENTSMRDFKQCPQCTKEYKTLTNRRFHSQINACATCGPSVFFGKNPTKDNQNTHAFFIAAETLKKDGILAIKGIGGFHLICSALSEVAIQKLRHYKRRPTKPFAVMFLNYQSLKVHIKPSSLLKTLLTSKQSPIVLAPIHPKISLKTLHLIAPNLNKIGVMIPYSPIHFILLQMCDFPIICTSANLNGEPLITNSQEIIEKLPFVDGILNHNREILHPIDDSVVNISNNQVQLWRIGRGYAPYHTTFDLPKNLTPSKAILALGSQQKNTITLTNNEHFTISPHIGNLENLSTQKSFLGQIDTFLHIFGVKPNIIALDCHPNYQTNALSKKIIQNHSLSPKIIKIQHHFAHFCSLLGEHWKSIKPKQNIIGVVFDGTGYGTFENKKQNIYGVRNFLKENSQQIWGGEFFLGNILGVDRIGHFLPFKLLGGESAIKDIKKIALSLLFESFKGNLNSIKSPTLKKFLQQFDTTQYKLLLQMWQNNTACIDCTSVGRLFDGVGALLGMTQNYDGEVGMRLETLAREYQYKAKTKSYCFKENNKIIDFRGVFIEILKDLDNYQNTQQLYQKISWKWHSGLAQIVVDFIASLHLNYQVGLSGGVFCNALLSELIVKRLQKIGIQTLLHKEIPPNDAGISFGEAFFCYNLHNNI